MAITIDWGTQVINVPRTDMLLIQSSPTEIRQLNLNDFRLTLNDLQDNEQGITFLTTHTHNPPITVGGVTLERVVEIINGYTVTFEDGQYAVNLVGANSNVADVTNVNQVSVRSANSAGLVNLDTLLAASYQGKVVVNTTTGQAGTAVPLGTSSNPVSNFADAQTIAQRFGLSIIEMQQPETLLDGSWGGYTFQGINRFGVVFTVDAYADVGGATFRNLTLQGEIDTVSLVDRCEVRDLTMNSGLLLECGMEATLSLSGGGQVDMIRCYSEVAGSGDGKTSTVDFMMSGTDFLLRGYEGGLEFINYDTPGSDLTVDFVSGRAVFAASCLSGQIAVRGVARLEDNTIDSNMTVLDQTVRGGRQEDLALMEKRIIASL